MPWRQTGSIAGPCRWTSYAKVASDSGTAFDPGLFKLCKPATGIRGARQSHGRCFPAATFVDIKITHGSAPAAGFEAESRGEFFKNESGAQARANRRKHEESIPDIPAVGQCSLQWEEAVTVGRFASAHHFVRCHCALGVRRRLGASEVRRGEDRSGLESLVVLKARVWSGGG